MSGSKVAEARQRVVDGEEAAPESITCDGSEFAVRVMEAWAMKQDVTTDSNTRATFL